MTEITLVSDLHVGVRDNSLDLRELVRQIDADDTEYAFVLGDVIHDTGDVQQDHENLQMVVDALQDCHQHVCIIGGNHDANVFSRTMFGAMTKTQQNQIIDITDDIQIVLLDTAFGRPHENLGYIGDEGIEMLRDATARDMDTVVLTHFPITYTDTYQQTEWFDEYPERVFPIDKRRVKGIEPDAVICGHLHSDVGVGWWNGMQDGQSVKPHTWSLAPYTQFDTESAAPLGVHHGRVETFDLESVLQTVNAIGTDSKS